jgi:hypothetical protein
VALRYRTFGQSSRPKFLVELSLIDQAPSETSKRMHNASDKDSVGVICMKFTYSRRRII